MQKHDPEELEDQVFRRLLAHYDEPAQVAVPLLAQKVRSRLPQQSPALAARAEQIALWLRRLSIGLGLCLGLALLALGSWTVLIDSSLLLRLAGDNGVGEVLLLLALLVKPLLGLIASQAPLMIALLMFLLTGGIAWRRVLRLVPAYNPVRVRP